jgi:hypothetical protein
MKKLIFLLFFLPCLLYSQIAVNISKNLFAIKDAEIEIPINVSSLTDSNIYAFQFKLTFNSGVINPIELITAGSLCSANNWICMPNFLYQNELTIGAFGSEPLKGSGILIKIKFKVNGLIGDTSTLKFASFTFNSGEKSVSLSDGSVIIKKSMNINPIDKNKINYLTAQNYPNPFNPSTNIQFNLPVSGFISLKIYNNSGTQVENLISGYKPAGTYNIVWQPANLPSGIYYFRLVTQNSEITKGMMLIR